MVCVWWLGLDLMKLEEMTWGCYPVVPPPARGKGAGYNASQVSGKGGDLGVLFPGIVD